jgi:hypothetical protein
MADFHRTYVNDESFIRGAARILWAGTTVSFPSEIGEVINLSTYDAITGWNELGATKTGIQVSVNNTEENFDVDQIYGDIDILPTGWECSVATQLAEVTLERLQVAWEGSSVTTDSATTSGIDEKEMGFGQPLFYIERRLAVLFQRPNTKIRAYIFRKVQRMAQESAINYAKEGEQQTIPLRFKALADTSINDIYKRFFLIRDQQ